MRYRLLVVSEDGSFRVLEDELSELLEYKPDKGERCTLTRTHG